MDFFEQQDRARRNTLLLTFFFAAAVVMIILAVYAALAGIYLSQSKPLPPGAGWAENLARLWNADLFIWTVIGTLAVIGTGTVYKISSLAAGGEAVARMFQAQPVSPETADPAERRLLNVVEEIAIASGVPVPRVFLLNDSSINAFAAGFSISDAVIGVTRGCMTLLTRDELQGVIAHEFSHILNGDMRLNLRLMGVLHGILLISLIGWWIFRVSFRTSGGQGARGGKKGGGAVFIVLTGLMLMVIGYIGVFFARIIKSAVSRQREFLSDASAVQFTRNPGGIAGALKKIGGLPAGGLIANPNTEAASHLLFADGLQRHFFNLMSTHPPLDERIRRIDPTFKGEFQAVQAQAFQPEPELASGFASAAAPHPPAADVIPGAPPDNPFERIGRMDSGNLSRAPRLLALLPPAVRAGARSPGGARAVLMAMLMSSDPETRRKQMDCIRASDRALAEGASALLPQVELMPPELFALVTDISAASLRCLSRSEMADFAQILRKVVEMDGTITLFEFMVQAIVTGRMKSWAGRMRDSLFASSSTSASWPAMAVVISTLAYYGAASDSEAAAAFDCGAARLSPGREASILPKERCGLRQVEQALLDLKSIAPVLKKRFLSACLACVEHNGKVNRSEAELLRAVAGALDCPVAPVMPTV